MSQGGSATTRPPDGPASWLSSAALASRALASRDEMNTVAPLRAKPWHGVGSALSGEALRWDLRYLGDHLADASATSRDQDEPAEKKTQQHTLDG